MWCALNLKVLHYICFWFYFELTNNKSQSLIIVTPMHDISLGKYVVAVLCAADVVSIGVCVVASWNQRNALCCVPCIVQHVHNTPKVKAWLAVPTTTTTTVIKASRHRPNVFSLSFVPFKLLLPISLVIRRLVHDFK